MMIWEEVGVKNHMKDKNGWGFILFSCVINNNGVEMIIIRGVILEMKEIGISGIGVRTIQFRIDPPRRAPVLKIIIGIIKYLSVSI